MAFNVLLHPKAKKALDKLNPEIRGRIREKLLELNESPRRGEQLRYSPF
ncbi:MAG: type II toxin-antitoxin system RelE/ParE family toxin [Candidatus Freyarchaeota archaeon]